jgi:pimeloyl-ACP methyl ester carboxylesterase
MPMVASRAEGTRLEPPVPRAVRETSGRASHPVRTGTVERAGIRTAFEVHGRGEPAIVFVPPWSIVPGRVWKAQVPTFARRHRVVVYDPRGNGGSDRPADPAAYGETEMASDLLAVMDAAEVERAVLVSLSLGAQRALLAGDDRPDRVLGHVFIAPAVPLAEDPPRRPGSRPQLGRDDYGTYLEAFFGRCLTEPHSTKQVEDGVDWGFETDDTTLLVTTRGPRLDADATRALCARVRCPVLVIQGTDDAITGPGRGIALAEAIPGAHLAMLEGGGHLPNAREPVRTALLIREFLARLPAVRA